MLIDSFLEYLRYERNYSEYTLDAYFRDLQQFEDFVKEKKEGIFVPEEVDTDIVRNWIISLLDNKISPVSVNRKLSSLKSFFKFLMKQGFVSVNPLRFVTGPKTKKPLPTFVKEKDMEELLDGDGFDEDFEGVRDRLILEMLYDTGVRRSELVGLQDADIDYDALTRRASGTDYLSYIEEIARGLLPRAYTEQTIVTTGIVRKLPEQFSVGNLAVTSDDSYYAETPYRGESFSGTGDLFASVIMGCLINGLTIEEAMQKAVCFLCPAIEEASHDGTPQNHGIPFEKYLRYLLD